jgi:serine/threonine-protein kinase
VVTSVDREHWRLVTDELDRMLELPEGEHARYLEQLEREQPAVAAQLRRLLRMRHQPAFADFLTGRSPFSGEIPAAPSLVGRHVGAYVIETEVGHGGMGSVWRARRADGQFEGAVAIKFLRAAWLGSTGEQRFRLEGSLLAKLDHPNIARLFDAGVFDGNQPYLVLEYVEGESIDLYAEHQALSIEARVRLFAGVLAAVAHAHTHLIVHRDIKPGNVLVTRGGVVKLLDFGVAKLLDGSGDASYMTRSSAHAFTPLYAAPEQLLGKPVTTATDVYALGLVLYQLLTGTHPVASTPRSGEELIRMILAQEPQRPSTVARTSAARKALSGDLDNILAKALRKDPGERYGTAAAFAEDLTRQLAHQPVSARADTLGYRVAKFVERHRAGVLAGVLIAIGLIGTTTFALLQMRDARQQRDVARAELRRAEAANDFSSLMLEEVDASGKPLSREQLLDRGTQLLDARYGGDREFVADMLSELAGRYGDAERFNKSMALTMRAISTARQAGNASLLAMVLCEGAHMELEAGSHADVDRWLSEAQSLMAGMRQPPLRTSVTCLRARGHRATNGGDLDTAAALYRQAHALQIDEGVRMGPDYTDILNELGGVYFEEGRYLDAYRMTFEVGAAFDRSGRGGTVGRGIIHENAAQNLIHMGELRAALLELEAARHPLPGRVDDAARLGMQPALALVLRRLGQLQSAQAALSGVADQLLAAGSWRLGSRALVEEGEIRAQMGDTQSARPLLEHAIAILEKNPRGGGEIAQANAYLADLDAHEGDAAAARARLNAYLQSAGYAGDHTRVILEPVLLSAARAALRLDDMSAAQAYAHDALAIAERVARAPDSSADVGEILLLMASLRPEQARELLARAVKCLDNGLGPQAPLTIAARQAASTHGVH